MIQNYEQNTQRIFRICIAITVKNGNDIRIHCHYTINQIQREIHFSNNKKYKFFLQKIYSEKEKNVYNIFDSLNSITNTTVCAVRYGCVYFAKYMEYQYQKTNVWQIDRYAKQLNNSKTFITQQCMRKGGHRHTHTRTECATDHCANRNIGIYCDKKKQ